MPKATKLLQFGNLELEKATIIRTLNLGNFNIGQHMKHIFSMIMIILLSKETLIT